MIICKKKELSCVVYLRRSINLFQEISKKKDLNALYRFTYQGTKEDDWFLRVEVYTRRASERRTIRVGCCDNNYAVGTAVFAIVDGRSAGTRFREV